MQSQRPFDLVLWGVTGHTGTLLGEAVARRLGLPSNTSSDDGQRANPNFKRIALAGRSLPALRSVERRMARVAAVEGETLAIRESGRKACQMLERDPQYDAIPKLVLPSYGRDKHLSDYGPTGATTATGAAQIDAEAQLFRTAVAEKTWCVATLSGPFFLAGEGVVRACSEAGTDYVDITAENLWVAAMRRKYDAIARQSKARIVFCCGFDFILHDVGLFEARHFLRSHGDSTDVSPAAEVPVPSGAASGAASAASQIEVNVNSGVGEVHCRTTPLTLKPSSSSSSHSAERSESSNELSHRGAGVDSGVSQLRKPTSSQVFQTITMKGANVSIGTTRTILLYLSRFSFLQLLRGALKDPYAATGGPPPVSNSEELQKANRPSMLPISFQGRRRRWIAPSIFGASSGAYLHWVNFIADYPYGKALVLHVGDQARSWIHALWASILLCSGGWFALLASRFPNVADRLLSPFYKKGAHYERDSGAFVAVNTIVVRGNRVQFENRAKFNAGDPYLLTASGALCCALACLSTRHSAGSGSGGLAGGCGSATSVLGENLMDELRNSGEYRFTCIE